MRPPPHADAAAQRDVLLATKLHVPQPRPGFLPRPRLLQRLAEATARELVLVCAPAGFGKTSLLADWARAGQPRVVWLSLDPGDNDPARFWRYVAAALDQACARVAEQVAGLVGGPQPPLEAVVGGLVNALAAQPDQVALVLDDYHLIQAAAVHDSLALLLERLPLQLRLVLAAAAPPQRPRPTAPSQPPRRQPCWCSTTTSLACSTPATARPAPTRRACWTTTGRGAAAGGHPARGPAVGPYGAPALRCDPPAP